MTRVWALALALALAATAAPRRGRQNLSLRKRLHVSPLIAETGTAELEWYGLYSFPADSWTTPAALRYTPAGTHLWWGRTEYGVSWSSPVVQWSATTLLYGGEHLDVALAPQAAVFVRDEQGARLGGTLAARWDVGLNSFGSTLSWSGATHASPANPAGTFDAGWGVGRRLASKGMLSRFTPHFNVVWERSTGMPRLWAAMEGLEYQMNERLAFDVSGQHLGAPGGPAEHQIVFGVTVVLRGRR